ncbi:hypothetical protein B0O80DRAFT_472031, partial [Mortierella sp. GBAus27b]
MQALLSALLLQPRASLSQRIKKNSFLSELTEDHRPSFDCTLLLYKENLPHWSSTYQGLLIQHYPASDLRSAVARLASPNRSVHTQIL